jgi:riboflavin biosynthesis pyrimidine reductase
MNVLEPLTVVYERDDLPRFELPEPLRRLYGGDLGLPERCLFANFVSTIDGVAAIPSLRRSNRLISDSSTADQLVMALLRASADAVLVGSGTLVGSPEARWRVDGPYPDAAAELVELRRTLGRPGQPEVAIVSASGSVDPAHPAIRDGALVLTTEPGADKLVDRLHDPSQAIVVGGGQEVDVGDAVAFLHERGHRRILSEGGPTLFGSLVAAGLVDELFLTVSPLLAGRSGLEAKLSLVENVDLLPDRRVAGRLLSIRTHGDHLFLRYRLGEAPAS